MVKLSKRFARRIEPGTPSLDTETYVTFRPELPQSFPQEGGNMVECSSSRPLNPVMRIATVKDCFQIGNALPINCLARSRELACPPIRP